MASEFSFDVVSEFDFQELRNAVDQVQREILTRYDFKGTHTEVTLSDDNIVVLVPDTMKLKAVQDMLFQKVVNRKLSPKIFKLGDPEPAAMGALRQTITLIKVLDQETSKKISKIIKEKFPKVKASIQGDSVRISSKSKDDLQAAMAQLRQESLSVPLDFTNFR
ncbi:MAG: YajQ family cyclic di-GMP-binding protein [Candidatus Gracilibacteria bacterium]|jgi:hypothetical protein